jgi:hypothetical protein
MQREQRMRQWWTGPVPLATPPIEPGPVEVELVVLEPSPLDGRNPYGHAIHHRDGACPEPERCDARIRAGCTACRRELVLCTATKEEIAAMMRRGWTCGDCGAPT